MAIEAESSSNETKALRTMGASFAPGCSAGALEIRPNLNIGPERLKYKQPGLPGDLPAPRIYAGEYAEWGSAGRDRDRGRPRDWRRHRETVGASWVQGGGQLRE